MLGDASIHWPVHPTNAAVQESRALNFPSHPPVILQHGKKESFFFLRPCFPSPNAFQSSGKGKETHNMEAETARLCLCGIAGYGRAYGGMLSLKQYWQFCVQRLGSRIPEDELVLI